MQFIIVKPEDIVLALRKIQNKKNIIVKFHGRILWINDIPIKALYGEIKGEKVFYISEIESQKIIRFYENRSSGALVKPEENKIIFYGWDRNSGKDIELPIFASNASKKVA
ncbi:MAG: hypothetical protein JHC31_09560 [Sulfurihydrogenibium sp.]|jgi:hypothetical protein|nr:hypothetical protein [Sulfurihydrogenibium sp.]